MNAPDNLGDSCVIEVTRRWVAEFVVGLNLCPFARREVEGDTLRYVVSPATSPEELLVALLAELELLASDERVETTLLIAPHTLQDFLDYNAFLGVCDALLEAQGHAGEFQVASFHPQYQFADTESEAPENYSNRSPWPMLHLLREASVERAVAAHPDIEAVPETNIAQLQAIGEEELRRRWQLCFADVAPAGTS